MRSKNMIGFRADPDEREKLEGLAEATGENMSEVLRQLLRNAKVRQTEVVTTSTLLTLETEVKVG